MQKTDVTLVPGLIEAAEAAGYRVTIAPDGVYSDNADMVKALAASYDPLAFARAMKLSEAAAEKWTARTGGITTTTGIPLETTDDSLNLLRSLRSAAEADSTATLALKDRSGSFHTLTAAEAVAVCQEVDAFVQSCYRAESAIATQVGASGLTWEQVQAIAISGFPENS